MPVRKESSFRLQDNFMRGTLTLDRNPHMVCRGSHNLQIASLALLQLPIPALSFQNTPVEVPCVQDLPNSFCSKMSKTLSLPCQNVFVLWMRWRFAAAALMRCYHIVWTIISLYLCAVFQTWLFLSGVFLAAFLTDSNVEFVVRVVLDL